MATIDEISRAVADVAKAAGPAVVGISGRRVVGSGVVVSPGRIVTNAHNVWRPDEGVTVHFSDGHQATAHVAGLDADGDIAVLDADTQGSPSIEWNGSSEVAIGAAVFGVSNPGGRGLRVTFGLVSGTERAFRGPRGRRIAGSIEHTAPLLPGSSGGPVVAIDGSVVGINTHRLGEGFYLAIPADDALRRRIDALAQGETPKRVRLGVALAPPEVARRLRRSVGLSEADGLLVRGVEDDSPAAAAGIKEGDLLTHVGSVELRTIDDLFSALEAATGSLELRFLRGNDEASVTVTLEQ